MKRINIIETKENIDQEVKIAGWVHSQRAHGQIIFIDLRDRSGICQVIFTKEQAKDLRPEWVVEVIGKVNKRPDSQINEKIETGTIEIEAKELQVLNKSKTPPFEITGDTKKVSEDVRMKYRYLDLRTERMKQNIIQRHEVVRFIRNFLSQREFIEIETPLLTKSTPEGSRDYVVPSRLQKGKFYALPQSPQQFKQLLMTAGFEKYFQIAKCLRDEDTRGDRQPEHTQVDMELSFVEEEDVISLNEKLLIDIVKHLFPKKKIQEIPFPRLTYKEAMEKYNSDKPDIRKEGSDLAFCWIVNFPFFKKEDNKWTFTHNPFSRPKQESMQDLMDKKNIENITASQYDLVLNGYEIGGGSIRNHDPLALEKVFEIMGYNKEEIQDKFGHMLEALSFGTPPHGGIALGIDRILMLLRNEESIREVIAFPKTGDGRDLMMNAPSEISKKQLKELGIKIDE